MDYSLQIKQDLSILHSFGHCHYKSRIFASIQVKRVNVACGRFNDSTRHGIMIGTLVGCTHLVFT